MIYFFFVIALILSAFRRPWGIALLVVAWIIFLASSGGIIPPFTPPQLAVTAAVATFILTRYKPNRGVALLIIAWPTYIWRINILHVPTTALELSVYATLLAGLMHTPFRRHLWSRVRAIPKSWWTVLALWVIAWILSAAFSADKQASFGALKAWLVDPLLFAGILAGTVQTATDRIYLLQAAITSGFVVSMFGLYQVVWLRTELQDGRLSSFFHPVANYASMYLGPIFVLGLGAVIYKILRGWWWIVVGLIGIAVALTLSYGAFLAMAVGAIILWVFLPRTKMKRNIAVITIFAGVLVILGLSQTKNFAEHFTNPDRTSAAVRYQIWRTTWEIIKHHPLFGVGPNNFEAAYRATIPALFWPPLEWLVAKAHNLYLNLWVETGILGLLSFLMLVGLQIRGLVRLLSQPVQRPHAIIAFASLLAILTHGLLDTPYFKNDLALIAVFIFILPWLARGEIKTN